MPGMTNYTADNFLAYITGKTATPTLPTAYVALFTAVGTDVGTGFTEVSGGAYARAVTSGSTWGSPSGTAPSTIANAAAISYAQATAGWGTVIAWGLYDALTSGNLLQWDFLGANPWFPFNCTLASPGILTAIGITAGSSPALANGASVVVDAEYGGATLPTGMAALTLETVAGLSADTFNIGVNTSTTGAGSIRQVTQQPIAINTTFSFAIGTLVLSAA